MDAASILDIKSASLYAIRVVLHRADLPAVLAALDQRMQEAAGFFEDEPVVIDASRLETALDWNALVAALKAHGLPTIGIMAPAALADSARACGLTLLSLPASPAPAKGKEKEAAKPAEAAQPATETAPVSEPAGDPAPQPEPEPAPQAAASAAEPAAARTAMVIDKPLRSGQRIYARGADLVVLGVVSHGAEVIADGSVHVYGPLRGKAMAGARGDTAARIYTTQFEAELIGIAGVYRTMTAALSSDIQDKPAMIRLDGEKLLVESLPI